MCSRHAHRAGRLAGVVGRRRHQVGLPRVGQTLGVDADLLRLDHVRRGFARRRGLRRAAVLEQHALCATGCFQRQIARAIRPASGHAAQQLEVGRIERRLAAVRHRGGAQLDGEAALLRIGAAEGVAVSFARQRAVGVEDDRVVLRVRHGRRLFSRLIDDAHPLPDDVDDLRLRHRRRGGRLRRGLGRRDRRRNGHAPRQEQCQDGEDRKVPQLGHFHLLSILAGRRPPVVLLRRTPERSRSTNRLPVPRKTPGPADSSNRHFSTARGLRVVNPEACRAVFSMEILPQVPPLGNTQKEAEKV